MASLQEIVQQVDKLANGRPIGGLQRFRTSMRGLKRQHQRLFGGVHNEDWTFHRGGREELQFNIGLEHENPKGILRFGVAFSLETSRSLPSIDLLLPKIARFNDYLRQNPEEFSDLWMWEHAPEPGIVHRPAPIEPQFARAGVFIFLGGAGDPDKPSYEAIMDILDRMMPLYRFVESGGSTTSASYAAPTTAASPAPGCPPRRVNASATLAERLLDINLRHNELQMRLHEELVAEFGYEQVFVEYPAPGDRGRIDVLVQTQSLRIIYEIKTAQDALGCIREAMGQLLEYGCWPNAPKTHRLVVVGEALLKPTESAYLAELNHRFPRPIEYRSISLTTG